MKISHFYRIALVFTVGFLSASILPASAQSQAVASSELSNIQQVFGLISNISLTQTDAKSNEFILDILNTKNEINGLKGAEAGLKAPAVSSGNTPASQGKILPPNRRSNKAF
jgi:hypothetical protein